MSTLHKTTPKRGQIWADADPRRRGRKLFVVKVSRTASGNIATCRVMTRKNGKKVSGSVYTEIRTSRFIPHRNGYKFLGQTETN